MGLFLESKNPITQPYELGNNAQDYYKYQKQTSTTESLKAFAFAPIGVVAGAADTVGQSLGLLDDGDIEASLGFVSNEAEDIYAANKSGYRLFGDVATTFTGAGAAAKLLRGTSILHRGLNASGKTGQFISKIIQSDVDGVAKSLAIFEKEAVRLGAQRFNNINDLTEFTQMRRAIRRKQFANDLKEGISAEAFILGFQNESELFFPEGQSTKDMAFMSVAGLGLGGGLGQLILTPALRRAAAKGGNLAGDNSNVYGLTPGTNIVVGRENIQHARQGAVGELKSNYADLAEQINAMAAEGKRQIRAGVEKLGEATPISGVNKGFKVSDAVIETIGELSDTSPKIVINAQSIDDAAVFDNWHMPGVREKRINTLKQEKTELENELRNLGPNVGDGPRFNLEEKIRRKSEELFDLNDGLTVLKVNKLGQVTSTPQSRTVFDDSKVVVSKSVPSRGNDRGKLIFQTTGVNNTKFGIDITGQAWRGNRKLKSSYGFGLYDESKLYHVMPRAVDNAVKVIQAIDGSVDKVSKEIKGVIAKLKSPTKVGRDSTHHQLDFAIEVLSRLKTDELTKVKGLLDLSEFDNFDDLKHAALNAKFKRFRQMITDGTHTANDIGNALMLRMNNDYSSGSYALEWFSDLAMAGKKDLLDTDYPAVLRDFAEHFSVGASRGTVGKVFEDPYAFAEDFLHVRWYDKIKKNNSPVSLTVRNNNIDNSYHFQMAELNAVNREFETLRVSKLTQQVSQGNTPVLARVEQEMQVNQHLVDEVVENALKIAQGSVDEPIVRGLGQLGIFTQDFMLRHVPGAAAASALSDAVQRITKNMAKQQVKDNAKSVAKILQTGNEESALRYLHLHSSLSQGWELDEGLEFIGGKLKLDPDSKQNKAVVAQINKRVGEEVLKAVPEFLPDPVRPGAALLMDELSYNAFREMNAFSDQFFIGDTAIMNSVGKSGLTYRNGHTIEPSRWGQEIAFVTDKSGKVVEFALGNTRAQAKAAANKLREAMPAKETFGIVTKDSIEDWKLANKQAWTSAELDVSDAWATSTSGGRGPEGGRIGLITDVKFIQHQLEEVYDTFDQQASRYVEARFSGTLEQLNTFSNIAKVNTKGLVNQVTGKSADAFNDAFQMFRGVLTNRNPRLQGSLYGSLGFLAEQSFDTVLSKMYEVVNFGGNKGFRSARMKEASRALARDYGFDPNNYALEVAKRSRGTVVPVKFANLMRDAAGFTQTMSLKLFEVGHALLTTSSIMTTTPHVISFTQRLPGEDTVAHKARIGYIADFFTDETPVINSTKLVATTMGKWFKGEYQDVLAEANKLGYLDAHISEFMNELTHPSRSFSGKVFNKMLDYAGAPATWSEKFARQQAFLSAYELFHNVGGNSKRLSLAAANDLANKTIADYRPTQRAELFKGAAGIPFAIFQTFSINYYQRLLQGMENKASRAVLTQLGTQAFVFGAEALPGWEQVNEQVLGTWDHTARVEDNFKNMEASGLADVLMYGTVGNLPKILGMDGIAIHTRGEAQLPRTLTPFNLKDTPIVNLLGRMKESAGAGLAAAMQQGTGGVNRFWESLIYAIPNRPLRGLAEWGQGYSVNRKGDLINNELTIADDPFAVATRLAGLKPLREAEQAAVVWRDRQRELAQREKIGVLRAAVTAQMRSGNLTNERLEEIFSDYIAYGGSPKGFRGWIKERAIASQVSKADREFIKLLRSSNAGKEMLYWSQVYDE